jgi:hypothetical protein
VFLNMYVHTNFHPTGSCHRRDIGKRVSAADTAAGNT